MGAHRDVFPIEPRFVTSVFDRLTDVLKTDEADAQRTLTAEVMP